MIANNTTRITPMTALTVIRSWMATGRWFVRQCRRVVRSVSMASVAVPISRHRLRWRRGFGCTF